MTHPFSQTLRELQEAEQLRTIEEKKHVIDSANGLAKIYQGILNHMALSKKDLIAIENACHNSFINHPNISVSFDRTTVYIAGGIAAEAGLLRSLIERLDLSIKTKQIELNELLDCIEKALDSLNTSITASNEDL